MVRVLAIESGCSTYLPRIIATLLTTIRRGRKHAESFLERQFSVAQKLVQGILVRHDCLENLHSDHSSSTSALAKLLLCKESLLDTLAFFQRLDSFAIINQDIVRRIQTKLEVVQKSGSAISPIEGDPRLLLFARPWLRSISLMNKLLQGVEEMLPAGSEPRTKEIYLGAVIPRAPKVENNGLTKDSLGRTPLHYAAIHGIRDSCLSMLKVVDSKACLEPDMTGDTPLLLAVCSGHGSIVEIFVSALQQQESRMESISDEYLGQLLVIAINQERLEVSKTLINIGRGLNYPGKRNRTALYVAACRGQVEIVRELRKASVDLDIVEKTRLWTPLIAASVQGHLGVVEELVAGAANVNLLDRRQWSAIDHAAYRGYPKIVEALEKHQEKRSAVSVATTPEAVKGQSSQGNQFPTLIATKEDAGGGAATSFPLSHVYVNLGSFNLFRTGKAIDIEPYLAELSPQQLPESTILLEISGFGCSESYRVQLPILEDLSNSPWHFSVSNPDDFGVTFKIFRQTYDSNFKTELLCAGIALLSAFGEGLGPDLDTVSRDHDIPLLGPHGDHMGSLTFSFVLARPLPEYLKLPPEQRMCSLCPTELGGHRGMFISSGFSS